ncbi:MAG: dihydrofolate reductase [Bacteroidales bacterium]|nr:dihydrofolate reductase [Bacteroidales bacterium]
MITIAGMAAALVSCADKTADNGEFKYLIDEFADLKIMRYQVPGWDELSLQQKEYVYHLAEAAKYGRDIIWAQNYKHNLSIRKTLENIIENYKGDRSCADFKAFETYAKRVFFSNGIHHHYAEDKFFPECPKEYFSSLMEAVGAQDAGLLDIIYNPAVAPARKATGSDVDIVAASAVNFYDGVTRAEVEKLYAAMADPSDKTPVSYGLNSKVVKGADGVVREDVYKVGGLYGAALEKICAELEKAAAVAENQTQKDYIADLTAYYRSGDLKLWDEYNIKWVKDTLGTVDFVNGFVEDYNDPLGRKATWEGLVNFKDNEASRRTELISENAQWFEDNSPVDSRFKKKEVKGVTAKVINVAALAGDCYPAAPIGINLPNADWIRREHGSKSVTIANLTSAYSKAAQESPKNMLGEFAWSEEEIAAEKKYGDLTGDLHTDLHECLGHGSGQLLPETSPNALGEYSSALEETRADLFGLYYLADPKLVELGILPDMEAYKAEYSSYIRNGIFTQFNRVELGKKNMEAHMQNRKLIADWCYEKGKAANVIEKKVRDGKTYFVVNDFEALRGLFGELLAEVQRIKSEGDYEAGKALVETYAVNIDPALHKEVKERYASLGLKPYGGFINPEIVPVEKDGKVVDYKIVYNDNYLDQMLQYGKKYSTL